MSKPRAPGFGRCSPPWLPGVELAGFAPLAPSFYALLLALLAASVVSAELVNRALFR